MATVAGNVLAGRLAATPRGKSVARLVAGLGAIAAATEIFGWMVRNPRARSPAALAWPGQQLQDRFLTAEPTPEQLEVADAALEACLELETSPPAEA